MSEGVKRKRPPDSFKTVWGWLEEYVETATPKHLSNVHVHLQEIFTFNLETGFAKIVKIQKKSVNWHLERSGAMSRNLTY